MVQIDSVYNGDLRCTATHKPSGSKVSTYAPADNQGKGELFSPTDLVATAMGTCMMTTMGILAKRLEVDITGATCSVIKEMSPPPRRIARLTVEFRFPRKLADDMQQRLEGAALACPVKKSLRDDVEVPVKFIWGE
jgi:putative redox protein